MERDERGEQRRDGRIEEGKRSGREGEGREKEGGEERGGQRVGIRGEKGDGRGER